MKKYENVNYTPEKCKCWKQDLEDIKKEQNIYMHAMIYKKLLNGALSRLQFIFR